MNKGKLYQDLEAYTKGPFDIVTLDDVAKTVENMLDSAKNDYPSEPTLLARCMEKGFEQASFQYLLELLLKKEAWFKRYFGESE
jgi:hypothetical protein